MNNKHMSSQNKGQVKNKVILTRKQKLSKLGLNPNVSKDIISDKILDKMYANHDQVIVQKTKNKYQFS